MARYQDRLLLSTLDRVLLWLEGIKSDEAKGKVSTLLYGYSYLFADVLDREILYRERTELIDVDSYDMILWLDAWPIGLDATSGLPLVALYNDGGVTPSYATALTYLTDYRVYSKEKEQGRIEFIRELTEGPQALKAVYTGGMATKTVIEGTDAALATAGSVSTLVSASSDFINDLVADDMTVTIRAGDNAGTYDISSVDSANQLTIVGTWPGTVPATDASFIVNEAGLVGSYPDLEQAVITQIVFHWKQRDKLDIDSMNLVGGAGMSTTFTKFKPLDLLPEVERALDHLKRFVYP